MLPNSNNNLVSFNQVNNNNNNNNHQRPQLVNYQSFNYRLPYNGIVSNNNDNNQFNHGQDIAPINKRSRTSRTKKPGLNLHEMTPQQKNDLKKRYVVWTQQAIKQLQKNAISNVTERIPIMVNACNDKTKQYRLSTLGSSELQISEKDEQEIVNKVHHEISLWNGVEVGTCKTEKQEFSDYSNTARNWFNRNKAKIYGNHLFYPIVFRKIYQFVRKLERITDKEKIVLFVDILDKILHENIQFRRSKAHPLIPHQTFIQPNLFKKACADLCQYYEVNWDCSMQKKHKRQQLPNGQYAKNRERSKNINNAFVAKIEEIKDNVLFKGINKPLPIFPDQLNADLNNLKDQTQLGLSLINGDTNLLILTDDKSSSTPTVKFGSATSDDENDENGAKLNISETNKQFNGAMNMDITRNNNNISPFRFNQVHFPSFSNNPLGSLSHNNNQYKTPKFINTFHGNLGIKKERNLQNMSSDDDCDTMPGEEREVSVHNKTVSTLTPSISHSPNPSSHSHSHSHSHSNQHSFLVSSVGVGNNSANIQQMKTDRQQVLKVVNNHHNNNIVNSNINGQHINNNNNHSLSIPIHNNKNINPQLINHTLNNLNNLDYGSIPNELLIQSLLSLQPNNSTNTVIIPNINGINGHHQLLTPTTMSIHHHPQQTNISNNIIITPIQNITNNNITQVTTTTTRLPSVNISGHGLLLSPTTNTQTQQVQVPHCVPIGYTSSHGQQSTVSQQRYSPLLPTNVNVSILPNQLNNTINISLHNIQQPQAIQFVSNTLNQYNINNIPSSQISTNMNIKGMNGKK